MPDFELELVFFQAEGILDCFGDGFKHLADLKSVLIDFDDFSLGNVLVPDLAFRKRLQGGGQFLVDNLNHLGVNSVCVVC